MVDAVELVVYYLIGLTFIGIFYRDSAGPGGAPLIVAISVLYALGLLYSWWRTR